MATPDFQVKVLWARFCCSCFLGFIYLLVKALWGRCVCLILGLLVCLWRGIYVAWLSWNLLCRPIWLQTPGDLPTSSSQVTRHLALLFFFNMYVYFDCMCKYAPHVYSVQGGQKRTSNPLKLEFQIVRSCHAGALQSALRVFNSW